MLHQILSFTLTKSSKLLIVFEKTCLQSLLIGSFCFIGCATVPMASLMEDTKAKNYIPPEGKASAYVARTGIMGSAIMFRVALDGKIQGGIAKGTYHWFILEPGDHNISIFTNENQDAVNFSAELGKNYFFIVKPKIGLVTARAKIEPILDEESGRRIISKCKLTR